MGGEPNQLYWRGIRPTDPAENIPVDIKVITANVPVQITGITGNMPVDVKAHTVNTPVDVKSHAVNTPVDVKSMTGNMPVDIKAHTVQTPMDIKAHTVDTPIIPATPPQNIPVDVKSVTGNTPIVPASPEQVFTHYEPPEGCTFVYAYELAENANITIYTVPADTIFYLTSFGLSLTPSATNWGLLDMFTVGVVKIADLVFLTTNETEGQSVVGNLNIAWPLVTGSYIRVRSCSADLGARGWICGYERPV